MLGRADLAAISVLWQVCRGVADRSLLTAQPFQALGVAAAARIGNCLGAGRPDLARQAFRAALLVIAPGGSFACALALAACHNVVPRFFSADPVVLSLASKQMLAAAVFLVMDGVSATTMGVMRGLGRAPTSALSMACTNWLFVLRHRSQLWLTCAGRAADAHPGLRTSSRSGRTVGRDGAPDH